MKKLFALLAVVASLTACGTTGEHRAEDATDTKTAAFDSAAGVQMLERNQLRARDRVFFDFDRHNLNSDAIRTLNAQIALLKANPNVRVVIEGHADERGTREYNIALGSRRAAAVRNYMIANGIAAARITTISYGWERPQVLGSNEAAWAQNRRAVTVLQ